MDVNNLFQRAEQSFLAGQPDAARADVVRVLSLTGDHPALLHLLALIEKKRGDAGAARSAFVRALNLDPTNAEIAVNAGNFYLGVEDYRAGLDAYAMALAVQPEHLLALRGRGACLSELGQIEEARADYRRAAAIAPFDPKTWVALGALERKAGNLQVAAEAFDHALELAPAAPVALHGRARVALERGEEDARRLFAEVERRLPDDPQVALGAAEALVPRDPDQAVVKLLSVAARFPEWPDPQAALARLRWERGEYEGFTEDLEQAVRERPHNAQMWRALIGAYNGVDRHLDAADAAARAGDALDGDPAFRLMEAVHASEGGDLARADAIFNELPPVPGRDVAEVRFRLKTGAIERAAALLDKARAASREDIAIWAWTGLVWRLTSDARAEWLFQPDQLLRVDDVEATSEEMERIACRIAGLHREGSFPIGQSLRGGTQTRGRLLEQTEKAVRDLAAMIADVLQDYWTALPPEDPSHPLLRHRMRQPRITGSWSVRLTKGGFHVAHIHPQGLLSSACYLRVPDPPEGKAGWLELGRPPADMDLDLPPLRHVEPLPGRIVLFPSYLHHGTVPFAAGERLSVAFDVTV